MKRIGLALSDPFAIIASGLGVIQNDDTMWDSILDIVATRGVRKIIVGMPLTLSGTEGKSAEEVRKFISRLAERTGIPVIAIDERFTSVLAADTIRQMGIGKKKREQNKGMIDELSAVHLLQGYLQSRSAGE